jgi:hypothetical protein
MRKLIDHLGRAHEEGRDSFLACGVPKSAGQVSLPHACGAREYCARQVPRRDTLVEF